MMSDPFQTETALVLFSGGQDSATCLAWALQRFARVEMLGFNYGQRHAIELECRDRLLDGVWGRDRFVTPRTVDVHIRRLRAKIEADPDNPRYLQTVRGSGYRFLPQPDAADA